MAQVNLDVVYNVKGLNALKQADQQMLKAGKYASAGANNIQKFNRALTASGPAAAKGALGIKTFGTASKYASAGVKALGASIAATLGPIAAATAVLGVFAQGLQTITSVDFSGAKLKTLGVDAGKLSVALRGTTKELQGQASQAELMGAAYDVASAGFTDAADAANVLTAASKGATGGFTDINTVANATTSVLNAYGKSASDAEALVDKFIQTQNDGKIVIAEYAANISKVAPVASALGIELGEVNAIISQVTSTGTNAEVAFTGLKTALAQLASGNANKALADIGVEISAADIEAQGLIGVLQKIKDSGVDVGTAFKAFGNEAAPVLQAVFNDLEKTNQLLKNQENSAGAAAKAQSQAADTIQGAWKSVQTALSNLFADQAAFGVLIKGTLQVLATIITDLGTKINILLAPLKLLINTVGMIAAKVKELGLAFQQGLQQSEGWQKISALFAAISGYFQKAADVLKQKFGAAFQAALEWAKKFGEYVGTTLFKAIERLVLGLAQVLKVIPGLKSLGEALEGAWLGFMNTLQDVNAELKKTSETGTEDLEEKLKRLAVEADVFGQKLQGALNQDMANINNVLRIEQARFKAQGDILNAKKQAAQADLDAAKTEEQRIAAAKRIYDITVAQADLQYASTVAAALAEEQKLAAQARYIKGQADIQRMKLAEAKAAGTVTEAHREAVRQADNALKVATQNQVAQELVTDAVIKGADATRKAQIEAAKVVLEAAKVKTETDSATASANNLADAYGRAAANAQKTASAASSAAASGGGGGGSKSGGSVTVDYSGKIYDKYKVDSETGQIVETTKEERLRQMNSKRVQAANEADRLAQVFDLAYAGTNYSAHADYVMRRGGMAGPVGSQMYNAFRGKMGFNFQSLPTLGDLNTHTNAYAEGGYVTGPQQALIGEGGEPEYVIPESKMSQAMARYSGGARGESVIPKSATVNVNYSGSTVSMGGSDYISKDDVPGLLNSAVNQTLGTLRRSSRSRLYAGFDR